MILLNIDLRIAQVRPGVEESVQRLPAPKQALPTRRSVRCPQRISMARPAFSAETADATAREPREAGTKHSALSLACCRRFSFAFRRSFCEEEDDDSCCRRFSFAFRRSFCEEEDDDLTRNHKNRIMKTENLESVARKLVAPGKGILAADESSGTIEKRLKSGGLHQRRDSF